MIALSVIACGRLGFDPVSTLDDASPEDASPPIDAATGPFGAATVVLPLSDPADDDDPTATGDLLEIYFSSSRTGGSGNDDIWIATRVNVGDEFGPPMPVAELNTGDNETAPEISGDGLTMLFASNRPGAGSRDIYVSTRPNRATPWNPPQLLPVITTPDDETAPTTDASRLNLVYNNRVSGTSQLWSASRATVNDSFSGQSPITELDNSGGEGAPRLDSTGLVLHFGANDDGQLLDILRTERPTVTSQFGTPEIIRELQTSANETDPWLSPDGRTIFFATDTDGNDEIYMATR